MPPPLCTQALRVCFFSSTNFSGEGKPMRPRFHEGFKLIATVLSTGYLTACNITGYDTRKHGIRYTKARDTIQPTRDTIHRFHGMRYTIFTGYDTSISRDTIHKINVWNGLEPLHRMRFRIMKKLTNLYLIFSNLSLILRLIIFTVLQKTKQQKTLGLRDKMKII